MAHSHPYPGYYLVWDVDGRLLACSRKKWRRAMSDYHAFPLKPPSSSLVHLLTLAAVALVSGMANGYNGTVLEGVIPRLRAVDFITSTIGTGLLVGGLSLGGLVGSLACMQLAYRLSRRHMVLVGEVIIICSVLTFALAKQFELCIAGRVLTGIGVGICGLAKPLIVSELSPPEQRGFLVSLFAVGQSIGMNVFYLADWGLPDVEEATWMWRPLVAMGALPAAVVVIIALLTSRSPYWDQPPSAVAKGEPRTLLDEEKAQQSVSSGEPSQLLRDMFTKERWPVRRNFFLILALMFGYNLSGTLIISNFAGEILASIGAGNRALPIAIGIVQFLGLLSAAFGSDRFGRRPLLLLSCILSCGCLFSIAALLGWQDQLASMLGGAMTPMLLGLMMTVEYAVGAGLNPIRIVVSAELMPNRYRSLGMSLGNAVGWSLALLSSFFFPILSALSGGPAPQFAFFGIVVLLLTIFLAVSLPETRGISFD